MMTNASGNYRALEVWQKSDLLASRIHEASERFKHYGLMMEMRHISAAIPASIANACGNGSGELVWDMQMALGWIATLEYCLTESRKLRLIDDATCDSLMGDIASIKDRLLVKVQELRPLEIVVHDASRQH